MAKAEPEYLFPGPFVANAFPDWFVRNMRVLLEEEVIMPKAPKDGVVEIGDTPFQIKAGEEYPEGGKFRESDQPTNEEGLSPPLEEEESSSAEKGPVTKPRGG